MEDARCARVVEREHRRVALIRDLDQRRCRIRFFPGFGDDHRDVLAVVQHVVALEWRQRLRADFRRWPTRQRGRIAVRDDGQDSRCALGRFHRDVTDSPARHGASHQNGVGDAGKGHIDRISGGAHYLEPPVDAIPRSADDATRGCCAHRFASLAVANARTMVRFASSILNWLCSLRDRSGQRDLGRFAKRFVTRLAAGQEVLGVERSPWLRRDPAQPKPRGSDRVAVEIEDDGRRCEREFVARPVPAP